MTTWRGAPHAAALLLTLASPACSAGRPCPLPAGDPLCGLNEAFRDAYSARRAAALAASGPVVLQLGDRLVLLRGRERLEAPSTSARYHELKSVAHIPFALHLLLATVDGRLDGELTRKLAVYRRLVQRAAATIDGRFTDPALSARQRRILSRSLALIADVLDEGRVTPARLRAFIQAQRADLLDTMRDAAREQVTTLHAQLTAWAAQLTPAERSQIHAVVSTPHMPRAGNLAVQVLEVWLGEPYGGRRADERVTEGERVVVAEGLFDEERLLALLGTHLVDRAAATAFFDDPLRLDRDLLSDGAEEAIGELLGRVPDPAAPVRWR